MANLSIMTPSAGAPKVPFAATGAGVASNTIKGLLGWVPIQENPYLKVATSFAQGVGSRAAQIGLGALNGTLSIIQPKSVQPTVQGSALQAITGQPMTTDIQTTIQENAKKLSVNPFAQKFGLDKFSTLLAIGGYLAGTALEFSGLGGEKGAIAALVKETDPKLVSGILQKIGINPGVADHVAPGIAAAKTPEDVQHVLEVAKGMHGTSILADHEKNALQLYTDNRNLNLPEGDKQIEQDAFGHIQTSGGVPAMADKYIAENGSTVNTDQARELFPAYQADRTRSAAVHEPASVVTRAAYERLLKTEAGKGDNTVLFTGGGTGAGKTSALEVLDQGMKPAITYDGNLSSFKSSVKKIEQALDAGYKVDVHYVYRDPIEALTNGALPRAERMAAEKGSGRTVPLNEHLNTHLGVPTTATRLIKSYADNPRVAIRAVDNSNGFQKEYPIENPLDFFKGKVYNKANVKELKQKAQEALDAEFKAGRISEATYRGSQGISGEGNSKIARNGEGSQSNPGKIPEHAITPSKTIADITRGPDGPQWSSLIKSFSRKLSPTDKVHALDYLGTPEFVLEKVGMAKSAEKLQEAKVIYRQTLKKEIDTIEKWKAEVKGTPYASTRIFRYLDGQARFVKGEMTPAEIKIADEIKTYLSNWADRLKLPEDNRIGNYITHIFEENPGEGLKPSVFESDPELAALMQKNPAGSVYDPFLQKREGAQGYKEDVWAALDAYVKRGSRKEAMDPALEFMKNEAKNLDEATFNYVTKLSHRINMRPTELDKLVDNFILATPGLRGLTKSPRPTMAITQAIRSIFYRGTLGLNVGSALRNLSQGANTFAKLGGKYTTIGYTKLFNRLITRNMDDLKAAGVLDDELVQDKKMGVYKSAMQKLDPTLFSLISLGEKINRGAAFYGARSKALAEGLSEEQATKYGARMVRETQFAFGNVDSPVALSSDIMKTLAQLGTYNIKQVEFLGRMAKNREFGGLIRYSLASVAFVYSIGKIFGMTLGQLVPSVGLGGSPVGNLVTGLSELMASDAQTKAKGKSDLSRAAVSIFPAGAQIRKTVQGVEAFNKGRDTTATGKTRFRIPQDTGTRLQTAVFGKSSIPAAQKYYSELGKSKKKAGVNKLSI